MSDEAAVLDNPVDDHLADIFNTSINETITEPPSEETQGLGEDVGQELEPLQEPENEAEEDKYSQLQEENDSLKKQVKDSQTMISRQGNERGDSLRQIAELNDRLDKMNLKPNKTSEEYLDDFAKDPEGTQKEALKAELDRRDQVKTAQANVIASNRAAVLKFDPDFDGKIDEIKAFYKEQNVSDEIINNITSESLSRDLDLSAAFSWAVKLQRQLAETKSKNTGMIDKINKGTTVVSGKSGQSSGSDSTMQMPRDITELSDAQLKKMLGRS